MINAGDTGHTDVTSIFGDILVQLKPDIFFNGGDIAYDDNFSSCFYTWDFYLNDFE